MSRQSSAMKSASSKNQDTPDVRSIMAEIREKVKGVVGDKRDTRLPFIPKKGDDTQGERKAGELLHSEELRYLNQNHHYSMSAFRPEAIVSHRPVVGPIIVKFKRKLLSFLWEGLFKNYFESEREYQSNLVRLLNDMTKYIDSRDAFIFWDLIKKIDYDVNKSLERIERIGDDQSAALISAERRVTELVNEALNRSQLLGTSLNQMEQELKTIESVSRGLERIVGRISQERTVANQVSSSAPTETNSSIKDYSYLLLENRYRGSEDEIKARLSFYVPFFKDAGGPVLEIGGGRGELQQLFKENSIKSYSVEMDEAMVEASKEKGVDVRLGDGIAHLESVADASLGGVIAVQVIEHLDQPTLRRLVQACLKKVKPGGKIIFETINTESMVALGRNYFRDPTHVFPLHPETMRFMLDLAGLKVTEIHKLSPYSQEASLQEIEMREFMTPRWSAAIEIMNRNIRRLNSLLYGHQDYCIVAEV